MKTSKKRLDTAYQRHLDFLRGAGIVLMALPLISVIIIVKLLEKDQYTETLYTVFAVSVFTFIFGIVLSVIASMRQSVADVINQKLYAVWKYKPETIYRFYRKMSRYEKKTVFYEFSVGAVIVLIIGLIMFANKVAHYLGIVFIFASIILFICGVISLPYCQYLLLKLRTVILGDAKEIIFSRGGIWYCGKVCYFGDNGITYHRVERKEIHGQDAIVFYYTKTRGFQQISKELCIPVSPKMAYVADDLVEEFNRSDLLDS